MRKPRLQRSLIHGRKAAHLSVAHIVDFSHRLTQEWYVKSDQKKAEGEHPDPKTGKDREHTADHQ
jgi:hypothetical protein